MNDKPVEPFQIWMHLSEAVNKLEVAMSKCNFLPAQVMMYQEVPGTHECDMRMVEFSSQECSSVLRSGRSYSEGSLAPGVILTIHGLLDTTA